MAYNHIDIDFMETFYDGNDDFKGKMISLFIEKSPIYMNDINEHLEQKNLENVAAVAHKFKASIDFVGARKFKEVVTEIEKNAKGGDTELVADLVVSADALWQEVISELTIELSRLKPE